MGALDTAFQQLASQLIDAFVDNPSTLTRVSTPGDDYDPVEGERYPVDPVTYSVKTSPPEAYKISEIDGTSIRRADLKVFIAAVDLPVVPDIATDRITLGTTSYSIVSITPLSPGDSVAAYELQLRQ